MLQLQQFDVRMLTDIQGTRYNLDDPEIATEEDLLDVDANEVYFCCGNLSLSWNGDFSEGTQVPYILHHDGFTLSRLLVSDGSLL